MKLPTLRLLLKHCPEMAGVRPCDPENLTASLRLDFWMLTRYAHTRERFGDMTIDEIALDLAGGVA